MKESKQAHTRYPGQEFSYKSPREAQNKMAKVSMAGRHSIQRDKETRQWMVGKEEAGGEADSTDS